MRSTCIALLLLSLVLTAAACSKQALIGLAAASLQGASQAANSPDPQPPATRYNAPVSTNLNSGQTIEAWVDGASEGWDGKTVVRLTNGQVWQQAEYYYHYQYAYRPKVIIFRDGGNYMMHIEGSPKAVRVVQLE